MRSLNSIVAARTADDSAERRAAIAKGVWRGFLVPSRGKSRPVAPAKLLFSLGLPAR
jgi:hypothetical protein